MHLIGHRHSSNPTILNCKWKGPPMFSTRLNGAVVCAVLFLAYGPAGWGKDRVTLTIPLRSKLSPVQRLNREGVEAIKKRQFDKAEVLFNKAYLYDPADPFTLNNLAFVSEVMGQIDQAQKFYRLALDQGCSAEIDLSSAKDLEKKPMMAALIGLHDSPMRVNRMNIEAMQLLSQGRGYDAAMLLQQTLALDPQNPFTFNNLGVANEAIGDYSKALKYYRLASVSRSSERVMISQDHSWVGKPVAEMAAESATRLQKRIQGRTSAETQASMLNLSGVYAVNQNDWSTAKADFMRAYTLDPSSAFSLNNRAYVAEKEGDLETAQFFYEKAKRASNANARVGLATVQTAEGQALANVATDSNRKVDAALDVYSRQRQQQPATIELTPRGSGSVANPTTNHEQDPVLAEPSSIPKSATPPESPH